MCASEMKVFAAANPARVAGRRRACLSLLCCVLVAARSGSGVKAVEAVNPTYGGLRPSPAAKNSWAREDSAGRCHNERAWRAPFLLRATGQLRLRGGMDELSGTEESAHAMRSVKVGSREAFAIECLKSFKLQEGEKDDVIDKWLERNDPDDPYLPVNEDVKMKFDDAVRQFDAEMRAEGNLNWRQEMAESIRHHTTIEPCDGASESGEDQDKDSHELVEDFEDSGKAAVGRRTRAQMSAGHVEMAGSGGTEMGACNEEEAWQRIEAEEVEEERSRREQLREMLQRGGGQEVGDEEGSGEVQEGDEEEEEMSWGAAGVEEEVMEGPRAPKIRVFSSQAHAPGECPQPTKYDLMQAARDGNITLIADIVKQCRRAARAKAGSGGGDDVLSDKSGYYLRVLDGGDEEMDGMTAMHFAAMRGKVGAIKLLAAAGASVNTPSQSRHTPLHMAALQGRRKAAEALLGLGAEAGVRDALGSSPLHHAATGGHVEVCHVLLRCGAGIHVRDHQGLTPLRLAQRAGHDGAHALIAAWRGVPAEDREEAGKGGGDERPESVGSSVEVIQEE